MADKTLIVTTDSIGSANYELGRVLMTSFFMNLAESDEVPSSIHFLNEGARLTCKDSNVIDFIARLEQRGVSITTCRTCLEYLDIEQDLAIGSISTMFATVASLMGEAQAIILA